MAYHGTPPTPCVVGDAECSGGAVAPSSFCSGAHRCRELHDYSASVRRGWCYQRKGHGGSHSFMTDDSLFVWSVDVVTGLSTTLMPAARSRASDHVQHKMSIAGRSKSTHATTTAQHRSLQSTQNQSGAEQADAARCPGVKNEQCRDWPSARSAWCLAHRCPGRGYHPNTKTWYRCTRRIDHDSASNGVHFFEDQFDRIVPGKQITQLSDPLAERRRHSQNAMPSRPSRSSLQTPQGSAAGEDSKPHHLGKSVASASNRRVRHETPTCAEPNCNNRDVRPDSEYCTSVDRCRITHSHPRVAFLSTCYRQKGHDGFHHLKSQDLCYHWSYDDKTGSVSALQSVRAAAVVATRINSMPARDNTYMKQAAEKPPQFNPHSTASASGHQLKTRPSYRRLQYDSDCGQQLLSGHEHGSDHSHRARPSNRDSPAAAATAIAQAGMAAIDPGTAQLQRVGS